MENKNRKILTGTGIVCLTVALVLFLPIFGFFASVLIPLEIYYFRAVLGRKGGLTISAAALLVLFSVTGHLGMDSFFFVGLFMMGLSLGEAAERGFSIEKTVLLTALPVLILGFFGWSRSADAHGKSMSGLVDAFLVENFDRVIDVYRQSRMEEEHLEKIGEVFGMVRQATVPIMPALLTVFVLVNTWLVLLMARALALRRNIAFPDFGPLTFWKPPEYLVWVVIGCGAGLLIPDPGIRKAVLNGLIVSLSVYFFGGIAIVSFWLDKKQVPLAPRVLIYLLIAVWEYALILVVGLGFFDLWANFRRLETPQR